MKSHFRNLALSVVLFSATFCSKDNQAPSPSMPTEAATGNIAANNPTSALPLGFNPQTCNTDTAGTGAFLFNNARNDAYYYNGSQLSNAEFATIKANLLNSSYFSVSANGHVSSNIPYANRINSFTDNLNAQIDEYGYYVYWAALHGSNVQNPEDVKAIVQEQFDLTIPVQPEEVNSLSQTEKDQIEAIAAATRAQMGRALQLFDALYRCEGISRPQSITPAEGTSNINKKIVSFKDFLVLRKAGKIQDPRSDGGYDAQRGFGSWLKKAVNKIVTVVVFTAIGAGVGFLQGFVFGGAGSVPGAFIGGAVGLYEALRNINNNRCIFGPCQ